jgi:hypothetical protein
MLALPAISGAAGSCPAQVTEAKAALKNTQTSFSKSTQLAKSQEIQAPRGQQDIQAPRGQDIQAPRGQEIQAPRGQQDIQAPRVKKAGDLVRQAEAACTQGDMTLAAKKAQEALALLRK